MVVKKVVMSRISSYLLQYGQNKAEATKIAEQDASRKFICLYVQEPSNKLQGLESKNLKLLELVEALGDYINSDESSDRING